MARRGGKAANRRDRQRRAQRRAQQRPAAASPPARPIGGVVSEAVEAVAERRIEAAPSPAPVSPQQTRGARLDPRFAVSGPSRLSERAAAEYHYVVRDLRNIAVLIVMMGLLLALAVVGFSVLKIGPT